MKKLLVSLICISFVILQNVAASEFRFSPRPNKAHLIQWRQWDRMSLDEARKEDKIILLSLSAVWCHWCHVMDETTYSDANVITYINENFIPIRVDSDMRPDIDSLYNQGGWPSTVFLMPDGDVIHGENYIDPVEMLLLLTKIVSLYTTERKVIRESIGEAKDKRKSVSVEHASPDQSDIQKITHLIKTVSDEKHGGFGLSQKFPNADILDFLISGYVRNADPETGKIITATLDAMATGEIRDSIEGGFFRYSTAPDWSSPHYEKMLDVNAGLIRNYASAFVVGGNSRYKKIIEETIGYLTTYLLDRKTGAFFGSQDADEEYYKKEQRSGLTPPFVDKTVYADANAQMITAFLVAYSATQKQEYRAYAMKTAEFIINNLYSEKDGVFHYFRGENKHVAGLLADNVLFGLALLDLYNVTGDTRYLMKAEDIFHLVTKRFYDNESSQFSMAVDTTLVKPAVRGRLYDSFSAISNYRAVIFLIRTTAYTEADQYDKGKKIIESALARMKSTYKNYMPSSVLFGTALRWHLTGPIEIKIIADNEMYSRRFLSEINKLFIPEKAVRLLSLKTDKYLIERSGFPLQPAAYVCAGEKCSRPVEKPEEINDEIKNFMKTVKKNSDSGNKHED